MFPSSQTLKRVTDTRPAKSGEVSTSAWSETMTELTDWCFLCVGEKYHRDRIIVSDYPSIISALHTRSPRLFHILPFEITISQVFMSFHRIANLLRFLPSPPLCLFVFFLLFWGVCSAAVQIGGKNRAKFRGWFVYPRHFMFLLTQQGHDRELALQPCYCLGFVTEISLQFTI